MELIRTRINSNFKMVRERRLELPRRLTHAPQTCLSTYSSTLADSRCAGCIESRMAPLAASFKAKAIIAEDPALSRGNFPSLFPRAFASCGRLPERTEEENEREREHDEQRRRPVARLDDIVAQVHEIDVIADQRGKLRQQRGGEVGRRDIGQQHREHVHKVEVALVHMRQQEGDADDEEQRGAENAAVAELAAVGIGDGEDVEHIYRGARNADPGGGLLLLGRDAPEDRKDGGGVVVEPVPDGAGLAEIERDRLEEGSAKRHRREHQEDIRGGEDEKVLPAVLLIHPEHRADRQEEHGLELDGEGERHQDHAAYGLIAQREIDAEDPEGDIDAVALAPAGAVEHHGGQEQHGEEAGEEPGGLLREDPAEEHRAPGEQYVEKAAQELDQIQVADGEVGAGGEEIEVGDVVIADLLAQRAEAAIVAEIGGPAGEEVLVIERLKIEEHAAQRKGEREQQYGGEHRPGRFQQTRAVEQEQPQRGLQDQKQQDIGVHSLSSGKCAGRMHKKRDESTALPPNIFDL